MRKVSACSAVSPSRGSLSEKARLDPTLRSVGESSSRPPDLSVTSRIPLGTLFESQRVDRLNGRSARWCAGVLVAPETGQLEFDLVVRDAADDIVAAVGCVESVSGAVQFEYLERARIGDEKP